MTYKSNKADSDKFRAASSAADVARKAGWSYKIGMRTPSNDRAPDPLLMAIGLRVRELREAEGMKPAEFARALGISQAALWRLEDGQQNPTLKSLSRLAIALKTSMSALLTGIEPDPATLGTREYRKD